MKRLTALILLCALCLLGGCKKQQDAAQDTPAGPTAQISYAAYHYDEGYALSEGWVYEMTLSADGQMDSLNELLNAVSFEIQDESFDGGTGYRLLLQNAQGGITRDVLIMEKNLASMNGLLYRTEGAQPLMNWLDALNIKEQDVE